MFHRGFTLAEVLVTLAVITVLAGISFYGVNEYREKAYYKRAVAELNEFALALRLYRVANNNQYPPDVDRNIPTEIVEYLATDADWPKAPWPGSYYDWDNWIIGGEQVYQITIRFCSNPMDASTCRFPKADWASGFTEWSGVYYCVEGPCQAHNFGSPPPAGRCVNC